MYNKNTIVIMGIILWIMKKAVLLLECESYVIKFKRIEAVQ